MTKQERASVFLEQCRVMGVKITDSGNWIKYEPCLPAQMILESMDIQDEIAAELRAAGNFQ